MPNYGHFISNGVKYFTDDPRLSPFYAAAGKISSAWAHIEFTLDALIWQMIEGDPASLSPSVTSQLNGVASRVRIIVAQMYLRGAVGGKKSLIARLNDFQGNSGSKVLLRNRAVHDVWVMSESGDAYQFQVAVADELFFGLRPRTLEDLEDDFQQIDHHRAKLFPLRDEILAWLSTLPNTWRERRATFQVQYNDPKS